MKYEIGDTVLILHSNEEACVVDIINDKMLMVDVGGVTFPVYIDQVNYPCLTRFSEQKNQPLKKAKTYIEDVRKEKKGNSPKPEEGMWLSFIPVVENDELGDEIVTELKLYLLNKTSTGYKFKYQQIFFGKPEFELSNQIQSFENFYLHDIAFDDINDCPVFDFEFSLLQTDKKKEPYFESSLKFTPKQLFKRIEKLKENNDASFQHQLFTIYPDRIKEEKFPLEKLTARGYKVYDATNARQNMESPRSIVDLHIEKVTDDWKSLNNYEILSLQLKAFEKYYDLATAHLQPSLIVIHGIGEGRLRDEIHDRLRLKKETKSFINQYDGRFGYGATEIFFQY
jgi:hypothetical protein